MSDVVSFVMTALRQRRASAQQVFWMAAAMINARHNTGRFNHLLDIVRDWPEAEICALADKLVPAPATTEDRSHALASIQGLLAGGELSLQEQITRISKEVALAFARSKDR